MNELTIIHILWESNINDSPKHKKNVKLYLYALTPSTDITFQTTMSAIKRFWSLSSMMLDHYSFVIIRSFTTLKFTAEVFKNVINRICVASNVFHFKKYPVYKNNSL